MLKTVIFCGGKGFRIRDYFPYTPKALVKIGNQPILLHIMNYYSRLGHKRFVLCLGHMANEIVSFFTGDEHRVKTYNEQGELSITFGEMTIDLVDTGLDTNTGGRLLKVQRFLEGKQQFFCTYADGLSNVDLNKLLEFHQQHGKAATLTAVNPVLNYGVLETNGDNIITEFHEKPKLDHWINGGFMVFNKEVFRFLKDNDVLEVESFNRLVSDKQLLAYKFNGFWNSMDTYKDYLWLNEIWNSGEAKWIK